MKHFKNAILYGLILLICLGLGSCTKRWIDYKNEQNTYEYKLGELEPGVYGYYNAVRSNIPSENYDMVVLYFSGKIWTLDGDVNIHYTDGQPKLIWIDRNLVHGDTFEVYVPEGTINFRPNLTQA